MKFRAVVFICGDYDSYEDFNTKNERDAFVRGFGCAIEHFSGDGYALSLEELEGDGNFEKQYKDYSKNF